MMLIHCLCNSCTWSKVSFFNIPTANHYFIHVQTIVSIVKHCNINSSKLYLKSFYWNCSQISIPWLEEEKKNNNRICIKSNRTTMINALGLIIFHPCQVMQRFGQQCKYVFNPKQISQEVCTEQGIYLHSSPNYQFIM